VTPLRVAIPTAVLLAAVSTANWLHTCTCTRTRPKARWSRA